MKLLHAIHDFLPRYRAGSEIYTFELSRELVARGHQVTVLCTEYDTDRPHGSIVRRTHGGLPVFEIINKWEFGTFEEGYQSEDLRACFEQVLDEVDPDVLHLQSFLNLSFDLPSIARERLIPSVATLHDFNLVCPSGGQRVHFAEEHVCHEIDPDRCARCFRDTRFYSQIDATRNSPEWRPRKRVHRIAWKVKRRLFGEPARARVPVSAVDIEARLRRTRDVYDSVELFVSPSAALAADFVRFGMPKKKIRVSDNGLVPLRCDTARGRSAKLRIGFVGTLIWHKGAHVLLDAVAKLPSDTYELLLFGKLDNVPPYTELLREKGEGRSVEFRGEFGSGDASSVYSQFDVLVVCSLWPENSPLVIHEAFMAGVPVVGSRMGGIPELVTHERNGLIYDAYSSADLATALMRLIDDPSLIDRFREALPTVKTIEENATEWEAIYEEVASRAKSTRAME